MNALDMLLPKPALPLPYHAYRCGEYVPNEARPVFVIRGKRKWYAPWLRKPDETFYGMSEAMAFRLQDAVLAQDKGR